MAMDFTVKEAKQLIAQHKKLLSSLEYIALKAAAIRMDVKRSANELISQDVLKRLILGDCTRPRSGVQKNAEVMRLIYNLNRYRMSSFAIETAKTFQGYTADNVRRNIKLLNPGFVGIFWFFGGKRTQENATLDLVWGCTHSPSVFCAIALSVNTFFYTQNPPSSQRKALGELSQTSVHTL